MDKGAASDGYVLLQDRYRESRSDDETAIKEYVGLTKEHGLHAHRAEEEDVLGEEDVPGEEDICGEEDVPGEKDVLGNPKVLLHMGTCALVAAVPLTSRIDRKVRSSPKSTRQR